MLRRSRGFVPAALPLPADCGRHLLACGAELKNTFAVAKDGRAWVGHHVGDLKNFETLTSFATGIDHFGRLFAVEPEVVVHDLHPEYLSTKHAMELEGVRLMAIQHHHAHLAACLAEHGEARSGRRRDLRRQRVRRGRHRLGRRAACGRSGRLRARGPPVPGAAPGRRRRGAAAMADGVRVAHRGAGERPALPRGLRGKVRHTAWRQVSEMAESGLASPLTTSAGRLFDAVAALCGVRAEVNYEGQAAVELEAAADPADPHAYPLPITGEPLILDARPTIRAIVRDLERGVPLPSLSARFHNALARASAAACRSAAERAGMRTVVLSGGVFQNRILLARTRASLEADGLRVLVPELLPPNDGGISYGQLAVASARLAAEDADARA